MELENIKILFRHGKYEETVQAVQNSQYENNKEKFIANCYRIIIYCLRGDINVATPLIEELQKELEIFKENKIHFIVLAIKSLHRAYQGREQEVSEISKEGIRILTKLEPNQRKEISEWEAWFEIGQGAISFWNLQFHKPIISHFEKAKTIFQTLPGKGGIEWVYIYLIFFYMDSRNLKKADTLYEEMKSLSERIQNQNLKEFALMAEAITIAFRGNLDEASTIYERIIPSFENSNLFLLLSLLYHGLGVMAQFKGDMEKAESNLKISKQLMRDRGFYHSIPWRNHFGLMINKGEYKSALAASQEWLKIGKDNNNQNEIARALRQIGVAFFSLGELSEAWDNTKKSIVYAQNTNSYRLEALSLHNLGYFSYEKGDIESGIKYFKEAITIANKLKIADFALYGKYDLTIRMQGNLAEVHMNQGDFDIALNILQSVLSQTNKLKETEADGYVFYPAGEALLYMQIGKLHLKKGQLVQAKSLLEKSLSTLSTLYENKFYSAETLFNLVLTCCEMDSLDDAQQYFEQLEQCEKETTNEDFLNQIQVARGVLYKKNPRVIMKAKAQEIFQEILTKENVSQNLTVYSLLNLVEILVWELASTGHEEVLDEINDILEKITSIAQKQKSKTLEIEIGIIISQFELIQGNISEALERLESLKQVARAHHMENFQRRIETQEVKIKTELEKWVTLTEENAPLIERVQHSQVEDYLATALRLVKGPGQEDKLHVQSS